MPFNFKTLEIEEVVVVEAQAFPDDRGFFKETFKLADFSAHGIGPEFVQDNYSHSVHGVLRGLHYQKDPKAQGKLVSVIKGEIFDVAVDIRKGSPTYGKWVAERLSEENHRMLWVPSGFAHGFCVVSDEADVIYKVTNDYAPEADRGIVWNDPDLAIDWPVKSPVLSSKDAELPPFAQADNNFTFKEQT